MTDTHARTTFVGLTPDAALDAIEATGLRCTNVCLPLNSFENRVYEIELRDAARTHRIAKLYRPQRWTAAQIREEHAFLRALAAADVPVCDVVDLPSGGTLTQVGPIWLCLFERRGGRAPEEITPDLAERLGALAARIHNVGATLDVQHRVALSADRMDDALDWLLDRGVVPAQLTTRYEEAARELAAVLDERLAGVPTLPIHGDLHAGNLILREGALHVLDFDDMMIGPAVQDLWLLIPGRDPESQRMRSRFLEGYERFRGFDRVSLRLLEPLRAFRYVTYATWLAKRWHDPIFPATWPEFGSLKWWTRATVDLEDALAHIDAPTLAASTVALAEESGQPLGNRDYFWDLD